MKGIVVFEAALGDTEESAILHRNKYSLASSLLHLSKDASNTFSELREVGSIPVRVMKLDTAFEECAIVSPTLLKLDLQGYELAALRGATQSLAMVDYVLLEVSFASVYEGEPSFDALYEFLRTHGFRFLSPIDALQDDSGRFVQMDALFVR